MITTTSRIENKKLLVLILPKDTMEIVPCLSKVEGYGGLGGSRLTWGDKEVTMKYLELKGGDRGACKMLGYVIEVPGCLLEELGCLKWTENGYDTERKFTSCDKDEEEIVIDAIPLATKPLMIVEYKIVKEGQKGFYHLIRADGSSKRYSSMIRML
ncbi:hypothetical protein Tco_0284936 [Tanacetum coccineum]